MHNKGDNRRLVRYNVTISYFSKSEEKREREP